jgi:hypothetical protein
MRCTSCELYFYAALFFSLGLIFGVFADKLGKWLGKKKHDKEIS